MLPEHRSPIELSRKSLSFSASVDCDRSSGSAASSVRPTRNRLYSIPPFNPSQRRGCRGPRGSPASPSGRVKRKVTDYEQVAELAESFGFRGESESLCDFRYENCRHAPPRGFPINHRLFASILASGAVQVRVGNDSLFTNRPQSAQIRLGSSREWIASEPGSRMKVSWQD